jgi:1,4-alpha-glucan branching enzyme
MPRAKKAAPKTPKAPKAPVKAKSPSLEKKYLKARPACKVTFTLPKDAVPEASTVCLMGEFNNWAQDSHPLKRQKNGDFVVTVELEKGRSYRFRYIIDGWKFENDWAADRYEPNPYGGEDSVVDV